MNAGDNRVTITLTIGDEGSPLQVQVPVGWSTEQTIAELLRAASRLSTKLGVDNPSPARLDQLIRRYAPSYHGAVAQMVRQPMLDGPATLGMLLNGRVSDTSQRRCIEPLMAMVASLDHWCKIFKTIEHSDADRATLVFAYLMLKGWAYDASRTGSVVFRHLDNDAPPGLLNRACDLLIEAQSYLGVGPSPVWDIGEYDRKVALTPVSQLVGELLAKAETTPDSRLR